MLRHSYSALFSRVFFESTRARGSLSFLLPREGVRLVGRGGATLAVGLGGHLKFVGAAFQQVSVAEVGLRVCLAVVADGADVAVSLAVVGGLAPGGAGRGTPCKARRAD